MKLFYFWVFGVLWDFLFNEDYALFISFIIIIILKLIVNMNILASRLPALKFIAIAGGIQLGLTLFSNVSLKLLREQACQCLV